MPKPITTSVLPALLAALAVLLVAWFAPLPHLQLGEEAKAAERMPANRASVQALQADFEQAQSSYKQYVAAHDVGADISNLETAIKENEGKSGSAAFFPIMAAGAVRDYLDRLRNYAEAGERYFAAMRHYDDELMAWTRSLGTASESLRPDTWPIVEYLKLYPPPEGLATDYPAITASDVGNYAKSLGNDQPTLEEVDNVRAAGRSIEYRNGLHAEYMRILTAYDKKVQAIAGSASGGGLSTSRATLATGLNLLLGTVTLVGLTALFWNNMPRKREAQL